MTTTAKLDLQTRRITLEIDEAELDALLQCAEIGIREFYTTRLAKASNATQRDTFAKLEQKALADLEQLTETIANA